MGERKKCAGDFRGIYIRETKSGGVLPAIERGECRVLVYRKDSKVQELIQFEEDIVDTIIQVDLLLEKQKKRPLH